MVTGTIRRGGYSAFGANNPWNFSCKLEVPSNAKELVAEYNKNYKTSYQLLPAAKDVYKRQVGNAI